MYKEDILPAVALNGKGSAPFPFCGKAVEQFGMPQLHRRLYHLFNKSVWSACYMPEPVLSTGYIKVYVALVK